MTFTFKLARRIARLRAGGTRPARDLAHFSNRFYVSAVLATLLVALGCAAGEPTGISTTVADEVIDGPVAVSPRLMTLEGTQGVMYKAFESMLPGSGVVTSVEWTATGGTIAPNGAYSSSSPGAFKVIGRRKGNPKNPPDTSIVTVVPPQPALSAVVVSPSSASLIAGQTQQFTASGKLSDSSTVAIGVTWTTTGGTIDAGGLYAAPNTAGTFQVIATHFTTGLADTANVSVRSVQSLALAPNTASLSAGGTQPFATTGTLSDGSTLSLTNVFYSATGGAISPSGLYTAPSTAGSYTVTAKLAAGGGTLPTASSNVSVIAPNTSLGGHAHEPTGFVKFAEALLNAGSTPTRTLNQPVPVYSSQQWDTWTGSWGNYQNGLLFPRIDNTSSWASGSVFETVYPAGWAGGSAPVNLSGWDAAGQASATKSKLYLSLWIKLVANPVDGRWENHPTGTKQGFIAYGQPYECGNNEGFFFLQGTGDQTPQSSFKLMFMQQQNASCSVKTVIRNFPASASMTVGTWHHWEALFELNSAPGAANGRLNWWMDGQLIVSASDVVYMTSTATAHFHGYKWNPTWGGFTGPTKRRSDSIKLANIYLSGTP